MYTLWKNLYVIKRKRLSNISPQIVLLTRNNMNTHSLSMENLTGNEYFLPTGSTVDKLSTFIASHEEVSKVYQYNQNEFVDSYGWNQCTLY